jgi:hypothetical protein
MDLKVLSDWIRLLGEAFCSSLNKDVEKEIKTGNLRQWLVIKIT